MNKLFGLLFIIVIFSSCAATHYQHVFESPKGLDFRNGKWLVNNIESGLSSELKEDLNEILLSGISDLRRDSVYHIRNVQFDYLIPSRFTFDMSPDALVSLHKTTDFDCLINIKADKIRNDLADIYLSSPNDFGKSESEVWIVVYEIKTGNRIYSHRIIASVTLDENDENIRFAKSANSLIYKALKKGLKELKKYSAKNI